jgi:hypothetical protein
MASKKNDKVYREADKGRYVTKEYAKSHPKTTVAEPRKK